MTCFQVDNRRDKIEAEKLKKKEQNAERLGNFTHSRALLSRSLTHTLQMMLYWVILSVDAEKLNALFSLILRVVLSYQCAFVLVYTCVEGSDECRARCAAATERKTNARSENPFREFETTRATHRTTFSSEMKLSFRLTL